MFNQAPIFITRLNHNKVSVIDISTHGVIGSIPVGRQPRGIAIDAQKRRVYVANSGFKTNSVIDLANSGVATIDVGVARPVWRLIPTVSFTSPTPMAWLG
ncbi:YncE family protein [Streptomyces maremycinicus]|uniref:YncE family protein n=1 Tax=Streptomyces maremycinicus TaxID=1679753 RepID=UPI0013314759|nr:hypothetical protein [Streptomyces sp. NBRC 110468]